MYLSSLSRSDRPLVQQGTLTAAKIENVVLFIVGVTAFLQNLRFFGMNLTCLDVVLLLAYGLRVLRTRAIPIVSIWYYVAAVCLVLMSLLGGVPALDSGAALIQSMQWTFLLLIGVPAVYGLLGNPESHRYLATGLLCGACVIAALSFMGSAGLVIGGRYAGYMDDPQVTAFMTVLLMPFLAWQFCRRTALASWAKLAVLPVLAAMLWVILGTASRTALACLAVYLMVAMFVFVKNRPVFGVAGLLSGVVLIGLTASGFEGVIAVDEDAYYAKAFDRVQATLEGDQAVNGARLELIEDGMEVFSQTPILVGLGLDNYALVSALQKKPHNTVVLYLAEGGLIFALAYVALILLPVCYAFRIMIRGRGSSSWLIPFLIVPLCAHLGMLVINSLNTLAVNRAFWIGYSVLIWGIKNYPAYRNSEA